MMTPRLAVCVLSIATMALGANMASGQDYPSKPIRIIASGLGGGNDLTARVIAQGMTGSLGQRVFVENRPSGVIPGQVVSTAPADGYTLLVSGSALWLLPFLRDNVPYDTLKDLASISLAVTSTNILAVHPALPVNSVKQLIALAKARPGELNYGTAGSGSASHLSGELFKALAHVNIVWVSYKAPAAAIMDLIAGRMQLTFGSAASTKPHIEAGKLRALAVTSAKASPLFPNLPTIAASGVPGYELVAPFGVFAPTGISAALINRLNKDIVSALNSAEAKNRLAAAGLEVVGSSPDELTTWVKSEMNKLGKVIKDAGIKG